MFYTMTDPNRRSQFKQLYLQYNEVMYACARQCTLQFPHLAEDVLQEAWLRILPRLDLLSVMTEAGIRSYLLSAVKHTAITMQQREARIKNNQVPLQALPEESVPAHTDVLDEVCALDIRQQLLQSVRLLTNETREVLYLYYLSAMSLREIADFLHLPYDTVRKRFQRGKTRLIQKLQEGESCNEKA